MAVVVVGAGGCLYTDPINRPPMISISASPTQVFRGDTVTFRADAPDPDGDPVTVGWAHDRTSRCPTAAVVYEDPTNWPAGGRQIGTTYSLGSPVTDDSFCVWAFATDRLGAVRAAAPYQVDPGKRGPIAFIDVVDHPDADEFSLYQDLVFSGEGSLDAVTFTWHLNPPPLSLLTDADLQCPTGGPAFGCLTPDLAGNYEVVLEVRDTDGLVGRTSKVIHFREDQLPCIAMTTPGLLAMTVVQDPSAGRTLSVSQVLDDGDPFPSPVPMPPRMGTPEFWWFKGLGAEKPQYFPNDHAEYSLRADEFSSGQEVTVRVEVRDRNKQRIGLILSGCGDQPTCGETPSCLQRVSWTIRFL